MTLTDTVAKNAKPRDKSYKLVDEKGLYLLINPNGSKWWRFRFTFEGKEQLMSLGVYDDVSLRAFKAHFTRNRPSSPWY